MNIEELRNLKESEDQIEFKEAKHNYSYNGGSKSNQEERRKCVLGYIVAFANEQGGRLVLGMSDKTPHQVVGTDFGEGRIKELEDDIYDKLRIRVTIFELLEGNNRVVVFDIPSRPIGKVLKFEGVPLMRIG